MKPLPNLRHLRYLVALHDHGHFGRAAQACFVTQSTLSAGIQELEGVLGAAVAERSKRSVVITPFGRRLVTQSRLLLREAEALLETGREDAEPMSGLLEVGVLPTIGPFLLPRLVRDVGKRYPTLRLALREDKTHSLLDWLKEGRLDLLLMAFPYDTPGLETFMLFDDAYRLASPRKPSRGSGAMLDIVTADDLQHQNMLLLEHDHCLHSHALPVLQRVASSGHASFSTTSLHTLVAMVAEGMGATLLPDLAINGGILSGSDIVVRPLRQEANARTIGLCWRKDSARADLFRELGRFIAEWAKVEIRPWSREHPVSRRQRKVDR